MTVNIKDKEIKDEAILNDSHTCPKCNKTKQLSTGFPIQQRNYGGYEFSICKSCKSKRRKKYWQKYYHEVQAEKSALRKYNITSEQYHEFQNTDKCDLCEKDFPEKRGRYNSKCIDHDHETGKVRGVLCNECNIGLGKLGDNIKGLERALNYLKKQRNG